MSLDTDVDIVSSSAPSSQIANEDIDFNEDVDLNGVVDFDEESTEADDIMSDYIEFEGRRYPEFQNQQGIIEWQAENPDYIHPFLRNLSPESKILYLPKRYEDDLVVQDSLEDLQGGERLKNVDQNEAHESGGLNEIFREPTRQERGVMTDEGLDAGHRKYRERRIYVDLPDNARGIKLSIEVEGMALTLVVDGIEANKS